MAIVGALIAITLVVGCCKLGMRRGITAVVAVTVAALVPLVLVPAAGAYVVATVPLGTAAGFSVLAGSTVTNTGPSVLEGSIGLDPGTSVIGFPPGEVLAPATIQIDNLVTETAKADLVVAYDNAAGRPINEETTADLANLELVGGVYAGPAKGALLLSGPLVLDGQNNPNSVFIFQTNSTLTTATGSSVSLINGAQECNVFWQVGSSATLGTSSVFRGTILALESITVNTNADVYGRALARTSAVTLDTNDFVTPTCDLTEPTTTTAGPGATTTTVAPGATTTTVAPGATTTTLAPGATTTTLAPGATTTTLAPGATTTTLAPGATTTTVAPG
ncbi:MAG: ice-binding family protein, partial [Acidimicrobiales bacterium]|nr:ice-binding family protein [Acidimicrobiales bacterium]